MEIKDPEIAYGIPMVSVVGDGFCAPYPVDLTVNKKNHGFFDSSYEALDINGNLFLQVSGSFQNFQKKRVMRDAYGFPLLTMRENVLKPRHRWTAHRGESSEQNELLFSVHRSNSLQVMRFRHEVFLSSNTAEDVPNFQAVESHTGQSYRVYRGENPIAEADYEFTLGSFWKGRRNLRLKIYPGVDYAFVVALVVVLNENDVVYV